MVNDHISPRIQLYRVCGDNINKAFADCSIPQEKSNAEINKELEISELSGEEDASYANPDAKGFPDKHLTGTIFNLWI